VSRRRLVPLVLLLGALALVTNAVTLARELGGAARPLPKVADEDPSAQVAGDEAAPGSDRGPLDAVSREEVRAYLAGLSPEERNPFGTSGEGGPAPSGTSGPQLSGTLWSAGRRVAWIDGAPHSEGERVGEHDLLRIDRERVLLGRGEERIELDVEAAADARGEGE